MNQDTLLQAVIANPNDDAPRLAYADWLAAQGDADRAAFIRVQCALARLPADHPQVAELQQQESALLATYGYKWAEPFGDRIQVWVYGRGFIERVETCLEVPAERIRDLLQHAPIRHLRDLTQLCYLEHMVEALPALRQLTGLEFWRLYAVDNRLMARLLAAPELANLQTLILHHDRNGNLVSEAVLAEALSSPLRANLRELAVNVDSSWRGPTARIAQAIARSPYLGNLRRLDLSNSRLGVATVQAIGRAPALAGLDELDLIDCRFTAEVWQAILALPQLARLRPLRLYGATLVDRQKKYLGELHDLLEYRTAFEARTARVDWETQAINPWLDSSWTGFSWEARCRAPLFAMQRFIQIQAYDDLEEVYRQACMTQVGPALTADITALPFPTYQQQLTESLREAVAILGDTTKIKAFFLRIQPSYDWQGAIHLQDRDVPDTMTPFEERSYPTPETRIPTPSFPAAAAIFTRYPLYSSVHPSGPALYLIARTIATFGRCLQQQPVPLPVWFSCIWMAVHMA